MNAYRKRRALPPQTQPRHVGHVSRFRCTSGAGVDDARLGNFVLKLKNAKTGLGRFRRSSRTQVLGAMTFVEDDLYEKRQGCASIVQLHSLNRIQSYQSIEVLSQPMSELLEARPVFASRRTLANQSRVSGEDHSLLYFVVDTRRNLCVFELNIELQ